MKRGTWIGLSVVAALILMSKRALGNYKATEILRVDEFRDYISLYARAYNVPVSRVYGIAAIESSGDPLAGGPTNDRGLMQITPIGLAEVNRVYVLGYEFSEMFDVAKNIRVGCALLSINLRVLGNIDDATRAYNVGATKARQDATAGALYLERVQRAEQTYLTNYKLTS